VLPDAFGHLIKQPECLAVRKETRAPEAVQRRKNLLGDPPRIRRFGVDTTMFQPVDQSFLPRY